VWAARQNYETLVKAGASPLVRQSTNEVLMMAPTAFASNEQAAQDNFFMAGAQGAAVPSIDALRAQVLDEYMGLYRVLADDAGVKVHTPGTPPFDPSRMQVHRGGRSIASSGPTRRRTLAPVGGAMRLTAGVRGGIQRRKSCES
jgi:hypothetical protein